MLIAGGTLHVLLPLSLQAAYELVHRLGLVYRGPHLSVEAQTSNDAFQTSEGRAWTEQQKDCDISLRK